MFKEVLAATVIGVCSVCIGQTACAGLLVGWGSNGQGETDVPAGDGFVAVAAGYSHSLALKSDGSIVGWGGNSQGQINVPSGTDFVAIAAGHSHSLALKSNGSLVGWGSNGHGEIDVPAGNDYVAIAAHGGSNTALKSDGSVVSWPGGPAPAGYNFVRIAAGGVGYYMALRSDGSIVEWGGIPSAPTGYDYSRISGGDRFGIAIKNDGSLFGWGSNTYGQTDVPAGYDFVDTVAAWTHCLARKADGSLVGWGVNGYGQTNVPAGDYYTAIAAGNSHSLAIVEPSTNIINSNWVGGNYGRWADAANWQPPIVPNNGSTIIFNVTIDTGFPHTHINLRYNRTINQLDFYGDITFDKWTGDRLGQSVELTVVNGLNNYGELNIQGDNVGSAAMKIKANVTNAPGATLELSKGAEVEGNLINYGRLETDSFSEADINGQLTNHGTVDISPSSHFNADEGIQNHAQLDIIGGLGATDETMHNNLTGTLRGFGLFHASRQIVNAGQIVAWGGSLVVATGGALTNTGLLQSTELSPLLIKPYLSGAPGDFHNSGTIDIRTGGGVTFDCNLVNDTNGVIELLGGTLAATTITQSQNGTFQGFGSIAGDVVIEPGGIIELTGPTNIVGDVNIPAGATMEISDGQTLITGHTTCDGTIHLIGGTVVFQGGCDCEDCNIINEAGIDRNHFDLNADGIEDFKDFAYFAESWLWRASWY